ncbi:MAG: hypothetical protein IT435_17240 [Phycisphaerales bacterium]|nr:hypothetical protein [Phycisphaerales bacterium]
MAIRSLKPARKNGKAPGRDAKGSDRAAVTAVIPDAGDVARLRKAFGVTRAVFHRLTGYSERALANWESQKRKPDRSVQRRIAELSRLHTALSKVIKPTYIAEWFENPNNAFGGLKPLEVVERGESDRLWQMIYELESGMPV